MSGCVVCEMVGIMIGLASGVLLRVHYNPPLPPSSFTWQMSRLVESIYLGLVGSGEDIKI